MENQENSINQTVVEPEEKKQEHPEKLSHGKKIGYIAFVITELVFIFILWMIWEDWITDKRMEKLLSELGRVGQSSRVGRGIEPGLLGNIAFYQFGVLALVWSAKSFKNFTDSLTAKFTGGK